MNLENFCEYTYNFAFIPIYIYEHQKLLSKNSSHYSIQPPDAISSQIFENDEPLSIFETSIGSFYGRIYLSSKDTSIILGPVSPIQYTESTLHRFFHSYRIPVSEHENYKKHLVSIPQYSHMAFISLLYQMHCALLDTELNMIKDPIPSYQLHEVPMEEEFVSQKSARLETGYHNTLYDIYRVTSPLIKNGDVEGLVRYSQNAIPINYGNYGTDLRRQYLVIHIILLTCVVITAIEGGLDSQTALFLFEMYINKGLALTSPYDINSLTMQASMDFVTRVKEQKEHLNGNVQPSIYNCIQYIRERIYTPLTVADVADYSGYSTDYFSRLFKKETGFNVSTFITNCKLYEAKKLLKFTNASIGEISSQLHFANQSHLQKLFKQKFKLTPKQFRDSDAQI